MKTQSSHSGGGSARTIWMGFKTAAKDGIRVNAIAPGAINTPMHKPETHEFLKGLHPVARIGEIKEIVDAVWYLTEATFTTGEILHVDGGAHAGKW